ncbi:23S rRNA (pseudouridine(1915)-N(3))-methyltransferase RlmH [Salinisphaera sp. USBA-960]|uniref:23S rRNA (pseudouridine(1915)-N(3))-methyltransferase RlmH n=1 Tax=Salinisphaera orenii TaxID=856731 RepID=UPI000DBE7ADD|nr:23S rRNA (pseudouridine(1915)-N(3))-methyltransferase RlmH [Salifodinibacter halophilus]NNC25560.1 23S rRNA (pseudouridine(1915)-N(3))-methyltransferase RlmH [Salifodinibacter halophilus]
MKIALIAVGKRVPTWVDTGFDEYRKRLPRGIDLSLSAIAASDRKSGDTTRAVADEDRRMLRAIPDGAEAIALDETGRSWSTEGLARDLDAWQMDGRDRALLVGGPDGLGPSVRARADATRSLSALTLPHALVRVIVAEQLYRAHTILTGHPYHRSG